MDADFQLLIDNTLSEAAQVSQFVEAATKMEAEAQRIDEQALSRPVEAKVYVNDSISSLQNVRSLSDTVAFEFSIAEDILSFIAAELEKYSPVSSSDKHPGLYRDSNVLLADGVRVDDITKPPPAKEYIFANLTPYAEKIERGESSQAPHGVYEVTANEADKKYNNVKIAFIDYAASGKVYPAIRVTM